jgi:mannose-6-phosphate isomerase-like protein (cupin superfamily)
MSERGPQPGYVVDVRDVDVHEEEDRPVSVQVTIDRAAGSALLTQRVLRFRPGRSGPRTPEDCCQEILYVVSGAGTLHLNGAHPLEPDSAAYVLPADTFEIENPGPDELVVVSVLTPLERSVELGADRQVLVRFRDRPTIPVGGPREFRYLVNEDLGSLDVTQFLGLVQPSRAPVHYHEYDEVAYIVEGEGAIHMGALERRVGPGTCILFPRGMPHCLENSGPGVLRVMGVFYPSGSPAVHYVTEGED